MRYTGSCLCGEIRFEIDGEFESFFLCHCSRCRKDTGSAHAANLFSATAKLKWLSGGNRVKTFKLKLTQHEKSFCPDCGSALPGLQMEGDLLVVPAGCLNSEINIKPQGHIHFASRANWDNSLGEIQKFDELPV